jgi:membrane associated rhomboid family serine protease
MDGETVHALVLCGTSIAGLVTHLFLHADIFHLAGNLLFLWVFGNAVCAMTGSLVYTVLFTVFGVIAAAAHVAFDGNPAIGASGAINGVVGMALAMFPTNRVSVFWFIVFRAGTFEVPLWVLALTWFGFDLLGAIRGSNDVAYWAHLGGFASGLGIGVISLKHRWLTLTEDDNASLADLLAGRREDPVERRKRLRAEALRD